jgi:hypothetical protein
MGASRPSSLSRALGRLGVSFRIKCACARDEPSPASDIRRRPIGIRARPCACARTKDFGVSAVFACMLDRPTSYLQHMLRQKSRRSELDRFRRPYRAAARDEAAPASVLAVPPAVRRHARSYTHTHPQESAPAHTRIRARMEPSGSNEQNRRTLKQARAHTHTRTHAHEHTHTLT